MPKNKTHLSQLKLFFIAYGIILGVVYLFNRRYLGYSMSFVIPFHMVLLFFIGGITYFFHGHFRWKNNIFKYTFNTFACYCNMMILIMVAHAAHNHYVPILTELIFIIVWIVSAFIGSFVISLPFKILQKLLYDTKMYVEYEEDIAFWEDNSSYWED